MILLGQGGKKWCFREGREMGNVLKAGKREAHCARRAQGS